MMHEVLRSALLGLTCGVFMVAGLRGFDTLLARARDFLRGRARVRNLQASRLRARQLLEEDPDRVLGYSLRGVLTLDEELAARAHGRRMKQFIGLARVNSRRSALRYGGADS